jgi:glucan endo-1,3-alpha-glucosidase
LTNATCASDPLGKPSGWNNAEDMVNVAVLLSSDAADSKINIYSGGSLIGSMFGVTGLNGWSVPGLTLGEVKVEVLSKAGSPLLSTSGSMNVAADVAICNYNYQVVGLN